MERFESVDPASGGTAPPGRVLVAFLADWCPFCRRFRPAFEALDGQIPATTALADVTDESSPLWDRFGIEIVPTLVLFEQGSPVARIDGTAGVGILPAALGSFLRTQGLVGAGSRRSGSAR